MLLINDRAYRPEPNNRYDDDAVADYQYGSGSGSTIVDSIGGYNLTAVGTFNWGSDANGDYFETTAETVANRAGVAFSALNDAVGDGNGYALEAWIDPANDTQSGTARILGVTNPSAPTTSRNLLLGQDGDQVEVRARTSGAGGTSSDGTPSLKGPSDFGTGLRHVVITVDNAGNRKIYDSLLSGSFRGVVAEDTQAGDAGSWDASFVLTMFDELDGAGSFPRYWLGKAYRMVVHKAALTLSQIEQNYDAGPDGDAVATPPKASFSEVSVTVGEWESTRDINIVLNKVAASDVTVNLSTTLTQATFSGGATATITAGQLSVTKTMTLVDDDDAGDDSGTISIETGVGYDVGLAPTSTWAITSNDTAPTINWISEEGFAIPGAGNVDLVASLTRPYKNAITVDVAATGDAVVPGDYATPPTELVFAANTLTATYTVDIAVGATDDRQIILTLSNPTTGTIGRASAYTLGIDDITGSKPGASNTGAYLLDTDGTTEIGTNGKYSSIYGATRPAVTDMGGGVTITESWIAAPSNGDPTAGNDGSRLLENFKATAVNVEGLTADFEIRNFLIDGGGVPEGTHGTLLNIQHYVDDDDEDDAVAGINLYSGVGPQPAASGGSNTNYGLYVSGSLTGNFKASHGEIRNCRAAAIYCIPNWYTGGINGVYEFGLDAHRATFEYIDMHDMGGDATKLESRANMRYCWAHHLGRNPGAHADGVQCESGNSSQLGSVSGHLTVEYNHFQMPVTESTAMIDSVASWPYRSLDDVTSLEPQGLSAPYASNSTLILQQNNGMLDIVVHGNWLDGGGFVINWSDGAFDTGVATNVAMTQNRFSRNFRFGLLKSSAGYNGRDFSGNVWDDDGSLVDPALGSPSNDNWDDSATNGTNPNLD